MLQEGRDTTHPSYGGGWVLKRVAVVGIKLLKAQGFVLGGLRFCRVDCLRCFPVRLTAEEYPLGPLLCIFIKLCH